MKRSKQSAMWLMMRRCQVCGYLNDNSIASKYCCRKGIENVVERVVPRDYGSNLLQHHRSIAVAYLDAHCGRSETTCCSSACTIPVECMSSMSRQSMLVECCMAVHSGLCNKARGIPLPLVDTPLLPTCRTSAQQTVQMLLYDAGTYST